MTEVGITSVQLEKNLKTINGGSVGKPFDSVEYKLINGELAVKGSSMASFIISDGEKREIKENEWFMTEDNAINKNGTWYVLGRKDDMIVNSSGENIRPEFVENRLDIRDAECALLGMPRSDGAVYSQLVISVMGKRSPEEIKKEVVDKLQKDGLYCCVDKIDMTYSPLVKGTEFKLNRKRLREDILSGDITFIGSDAVKGKKQIYVDDMKKAVAKAFEKVLGKELSLQQYDANFFMDLDGTSLCYFELIEEIKNEFNVNLLSETEEALHTVNDIYEYIKKQKVK